jgi:hypothetical protein
VTDSTGSTGSSGWTGSAPISPAPVTGHRPAYQPACLANGPVGLRVGRIPLVDGLCIVNGLIERDRVEDGEGFARAPHPLWGHGQVDGHRLSDHPELASLVRIAGFGRLENSLRQAQ